MNGAQPSTLHERAAHVLARIADACHRSGRKPDEVLVVAVTKTVPLEMVRRAQEVGLDHFGENYAQELAAKASAVAATWHFVGKLQRGAAGRVCDLADVIHSAEPGGALMRIARRAHAGGRTIPCLAQVDFTRHRQGLPPEDLERFVQDAASLQGIRLVGLMTLPPLSADPSAARPYFARLRELRDRLESAWPNGGELSMGMSADYEIAVEEGATMVRVGSALFGERSPAPGGEGP